MRALSLMLMVWLGIAVCAPATGSDLKAEGFTLANGLEVQVIPYHRAPVVTQMLWLRAGAADEAKGVSGVAHYLEHMMFKGTPEVPNGEYTRRLERLGGTHNAFTGQDFTAYYVTIAAKHLAEAMRLEADRMQHLAPEGFAEEREVIIEERRARIDNTPMARLGEQMDKQLFAGHPYHIPIIGWPEEMAQLDEADVMAFYRRYYRPNNAVLVLVGDITAETARRLAEQYYGDWQPGEVPARHWPAYTPPQQPQTVRLVGEEVQQPLWRRDYPVPSLAYGETSQAFALMELADLLGDGRTSWLYRQLVQTRKLAVSASATYNAFTLGPSTLSVSLVPAEGVSMDALEAAYEQAIDEFHAREVTPRELERVKNGLKAEAIYLRDGIHSQAYLLGQLVMLGFDASFLQAWPERLEAVDAAQIKETAQAYLKPAQAVTGILLPEGGGS